MQDSRIEYLFRQYSNEVHKFLAYYTRAHDVDDLVQDTFVKAIKGLNEFRGENARAWLIAIARNVAVDHLRKSKPTLLVDQEKLSQIPSNSRSPEDWIEVRDDKKQLLHHVENLKASYREVIICRAFMDMTAEEAANVLGWSRNRVDVTLHRAIKNLRALMTEKSGGGSNDVAKRR